MSQTGTAVVKALMCVLIVVGAVAISGGCADRGSADPYYNLTFVNGTDQALSDVVLTFGGYELDLGSIGGGVTKSEVGCMEPVSRSIALCWTLPDGTAGRWKTTLGQSLPRGFEGKIRLTLKPDATVALDITRKSQSCRMGRFLPMRFLLRLFGDGGMSDAAWLGSY